MADLNTVVLRVRRRLHDAVVGVATVTASPATVYSLADTGSPSLGTIANAVVEDVLQVLPGFYAVLFEGNFAFIESTDADLVVTIGTKPIYPQYVYEDAVNRALARLNLDLCTTYTLATLPVKYDYLLELAATIEMAWVRAGEEASDDVPDSVGGRISQVSVPNLSVLKTVASKKGPAFWASMTESMEDEYLRILDSLAAKEVTAKNTIQEVVLFRTSRRTGRRSPRALDIPIPVVPIVAVLDTVDVLKVLLTWDKIQELHLLRYEVHRADNVLMTDRERIYTTQDVHENLTDDLPGVGTWYYTLTAVNDQELKDISAVVSITVV